MFLDTSGYYALVVERDEHHLAAKQIMREATKRRYRFVTTDYVLAETATLLRARGYDRYVEPFFESVFSSKACAIQWMDPERFQLVRDFLRKHGDKAWSFTDCFSFHVMREHKLRRALATDHHFQQAGFEPMLLLH